LYRTLLESHGGQKNITVLTQREALEVVSDIARSARNFTAIIAALGLFMSGIGVMNIMLLSVSERTKEIGIRKSIGATSSQIFAQFMLEALVKSLLGGVVALAASGLLILVIRYFTTLEPVLTLPIVLIALIMSLSVGAIFGILPAQRAAKKDPILALRS
jgi:putative ABC transport system permease protein